MDIDKMYCGAIARGDVFIAELESGKEQAVVVLQDNVLNDGLPTVICAPIKPYKKNDEVLVNEALLKKYETELEEEHVCMMHKIITVDRRLMRHKKGELKPERLQELYNKLDITLGRFRDRQDS